MGVPRAHCMVHSINNAPGRQAARAPGPYRLVCGWHLDPRFEGKMREIFSTLRLSDSDLMRNFTDKTSVLVHVRKVYTLHF